MDELEISGRRYISTKRAGKDHKYHADYIGQLIRAKKVAGQKVGRSWYVDAESLAEYLGAEVPARKQNAPVARIIEKVVLSVPPVEVVEQAYIQEDALPKVDGAQVPEEAAQQFENTNASHIPIKINTQEEKKLTPVFYRTAKEEREARTTLRYIADEGPLLPRIQKAPARIYQEARPAPIPARIAPQRVHAPLPEVTYTHETPIFVNQPTPEKRQNNKKVTRVILFARQAGAVLALGAIVFSIAAFAASHLTFTETLDGTQGAVVGYGIK